MASVCVCTRFPPEVLYKNWPFGHRLIQTASSWDEAFLPLVSFAVETMISTVDSFLKILKYLKQAARGSSQERRGRLACPRLVACIGLGFNFKEGFWVAIAMRGC